MGKLIPRVGIKNNMKKVDGTQDFVGVLRKAKVSIQLASIFTFQEVMI